MAEPQSSRAVVEPVPLTDESPRSNTRKQPEWTPGDWNSQFQTLITQYRMTAVDNRTQLNQELLNLARNFVHTAKTYGRIIIQERYLEVRPKTGQQQEQHEFYKTIEPVDVGGVAGGQKYMIAGILFKFAVDNHGLYGGDKGAIKMASLELQGLQAYLNLQLPGLHFPLMAIVDFLGFRLIACSLLPISRETLIYGTADQGHSMHKAEPAMNALMRRAGEALHIRRHVCGVQRGQLRLLWAAADVEGHRGRDGRFYLVDYARTFPPTRGRRLLTGEHLFQRFRPELLSHSTPSPLCPDALSHFVDYDPQRGQYDADIAAATDYLLGDGVDAAVADLERLCGQAVRQQRLHYVNVGEVVHRHGVNYRYLGVCAQRTRDRLTRLMLCVEIVARVIKNELRADLRAEMQQFRVPLDTRYCQLVVLFFNVAFFYALPSQSTARHSGLAAHFWNTIVPREAALWFNLESFDVLASAPGQHYSPITFLTERLATTADEQQHSMCGLLIRRLSSMCGIRLRPDAVDLDADFSVPFNELLVDALEPTVKQMSIVDNATGNYLFQMANGASEARQSVALYQQATARYTRALCANPRDWETLLNQAECYYKILVFELSAGVSMANIKLDPAHHLVAVIEHHYQLAEHASNKHPWVLLKYARFLTRLPDRLDDAEYKFLESLKQDPSNTDGLRNYSHFLRCERNDSVASDRFDERFENVQKRRSARTP